MPETLDLDCAVNHLVRCMQTYESDTFSASRTNLTEATARQMAAYLIYKFLFDSRGCPESGIDGIAIAEALDAVECTRLQS